MIRQKIRRGELWWAELPDPMGHEAGYRRPVVIVQSDYFNRSALGTVVIAPLTTNLIYRDTAGHLLIKTPEGGLHRDSIIILPLLSAIDRSLLSTRIGQVRPYTMAQIEHELCIVLSLEP